MPDPKPLNHPPFMIAKYRASPKPTPSVLPPLPKPNPKYVDVKSKVIHR